MTDTSALKLHRIERYIRERVGVLSDHLAPGGICDEPWVKSDTRMYVIGQQVALRGLVLEYFLTPDESAEIEKTRREMGFR